MPKTSQRIAGFSESVIRRMTRVANQFGAINLSQGFPDFDPPPALLKAGAKTMAEGPHQYAITWGSAAFRQALAAKQSRFTGLTLDPEKHLVATCGSTEAMMAAMMTVTDPGDKVIVFSPFYENYAADAILCGAEPIYVPLNLDDFSFDPTALRRAFEQKPKAVVLCNPSNPSGKVFSRQELQLLADLAAEFDCFVLTDEVYEHIVYPPHRHTWFCTLPGMWERTLSCSSLSKTYSITGWRLGYVMGPEHLLDGVKKVHDFLTVGAAAPLMEAAATALAFPDSYYEEMAREYTEKKQRFLGWLDQAGLHYFEPQGAYYVLVDISEFGASSDEEFCLWLIKTVGVAAVPGSSFFREGVHRYIRFHFAKKFETLDAAGEKLIHLRRLWAQEKIT